LGIELLSLYSKTNKDERAHQSQSRKDKMRNFLKANLHTKFLPDGN